MDFKEKAELFNDFFTRQCSLVDNNSKLPSVVNKNTHQSLSTVEFSTYDILKIIRNLDPNKAHGDDMISIRMLNICDESICKPLGIIFRSCLENGKFPSQWEKANMIPVFKKKTTDKKQRTIAPFLYCLFLAKYLKGSYMTVCLSFSTRIL